MNVLAMRIIPPVGKTPYEFSADKPGTSGLGLSWYKVSEYIVPTDWTRRVSPHCAFFLGEDLLWHTAWVTANQMNDAYRTAIHLSDFADAVLQGKVVETSTSGMSYSEMINMVRFALGRKGALLTCEIQPEKLYAEYGAKVEFYYPRNIYFDAHDDRFEQMLITL